MWFQKFVFKLSVGVFIIKKSNSVCNRLVISELRFEMKINDEFSPATRLLLFTHMSLEIYHILRYSTCTVFTKLQYELYIDINIIIFYIIFIIFKIDFYFKIIFLKLNKHNSNIEVHCYDIISVGSKYFKVFQY